MYFSSSGTILAIRYILDSVEITAEPGIEKRFGCLLGEQIMWLFIAS